MGRRLVCTNVTWASDCGYTAGKLNCGCVHSILQDGKGEKLWNM